MTEKKQIRSSPPTVDGHQYSNYEGAIVRVRRKTSEIRRRRFSMGRIEQVPLPNAEQDDMSRSQIPIQNGMQRPFTAIGGRISAVRPTSPGFAPDHKPSQHLVTDSMFKAMLDESETKRSRTTRRSSMDLLRTIPFGANNLISTSRRRLSLDNVTAFFDPERVMKRELGVSDNSYSSHINQKVPISESFTDDDSMGRHDGHKLEILSGNNENEFSPNSPHPTIEYLPLYFVLKRFPSILNAMECFYRVRWELKYPLQRPVFLSKKLRKIGINVTWGECLFMLPFIAIFVRGLVTSFIHPSVSKSGAVARLPLVICFLTANHNSILTLLLGIPFERLIKYHKISGYLSFLNGIFHTYVAWIAHKQKIGDNREVLKFASNDQVNMSGTLLLCVIFSMILTASPYVRRKAFEVFYYFHIIFAMAMMGCAFYHSGILVPVLASVLWGGDLIIRKLYMARFRYPRKASIIQLTDTVVELRIPKSKGFDYNPGQYVKIAVPDLSIFQWHPISISSSPHQAHITLHIRKRGVWTTRLHELAKKKSEIPILLEGPYGSLSVDLTSNRYSMVMLLSGGIGVTPMQSIAHQLMYEHEWGERQLKKLWFVWTARDPQVMSNMDVVSNHNRNSISKNIEIENTTIVESSHQTSSSQSGLETMSMSNKTDASVTFMAGKGFTALPGSRTTDEELDREMPLEDFIDDDDGEDEAVGKQEVEDEVEIVDLEMVEGSVFTLETMKGLAAESQFHSKEEGKAENGELLELDCYLTAKETQDCGLGDLPFVNQCRPDMKKIFLSMRGEAILRGEKRVAICVCAPQRLVSITREACVKYSNRHVRFDFHSEVFD